MNHMLPDPALIFRFGRHLRARLGAGVLLLIPLVVTYIVLKFIWDFIYGSLYPVFELAGKEVGGVEILLQIVVVAIIVILLYSVGWLARSVFGRQIITYWHQTLESIPFVRSIYRSVRLVTEMVGSNQEFSTKRVVLVEFPRSDFLSMGIITSYFVSPDGERFLTVYIPTAPNPTSGFLVYLKHDQVKETGLTYDDAMRIVMSGGVLSEEVTLSANSRGD